MQRKRPDLLDSGRLIFLHITREPWGYFGSRIGGAEVGSTFRFTVVESGAPVADPPTSGSLIGVDAGSTFRFMVVPLGATVVGVSTLGSLVGVAAGSTFRFTVVLLGAAVGDIPTGLLADISTSGLAVGLTGAVGLAVGLTVPAGLPRCPTLTPVRSPSSIPIRIIFFIQRPPFLKCRPSRI
jgi:hypothetical protein